MEISAASPILLPMPLSRPNYCITRRGSFESHWRNSLHGSWKAMMNPTLCCPRHSCRSFLNGWDSHSLPTRYGRASTNTNSTRPKTKCRTICLSNYILSKWIWPLLPPYNTNSRCLTLTHPLTRSLTHSQSTLQSISYYRVDSQGQSIGTANRKTADFCATKTSGDREQILRPGPIRTSSKRCASSPC